MRFTESVVSQTSSLTKAISSLIISQQTCATSSRTTTSTHHAPTPVSTSTRSSWTVAHKVPAPERLMNGSSSRETSVSIARGRYHCGSEVGGKGVVIHCYMGLAATVDNYNSCNSNIGSSVLFSLLSGFSGLRLSLSTISFFLLLCFLTAYQMVNGLLTSPSSLLYCLAICQCLGAVGSTYQYLCIL